jgi:hypothetical protein
VKPACIRETLKKDITRSIDGVIKASDESHLLQEVEEYVITREVDRELRRLVESYAKSMEKRSGFPFNGVWISGYFGSGKSHLLKILSLIMSDRTIDGRRLKDIFLAKIDDALFRADLEKVLDVPSTSLLFNIEQMADGTKARNGNSVLFAFARMFNRMRGYYDESGPLANFERDLDDEGSLQSFIEFYKNKNGSSWASARPKALLLSRGKFVETLAAFKKLDADEAARVIKRYEDGYSLSVDSFCAEVARWLDGKQDKRHRFNFFVDEVGQFIAGDTQRMLALQTIVETLGVVTKERAWVFVTSQEAIDRIVGDASQHQSTDFSKIIARFKFRIALSSADVREVIQRRLLEKNEEGAAALRDFYHAEKDNMRTVFGFREGAKSVHYKDEEAFVYSYPFPAYQYDLLQEALHGLGEHNAFVGKHVSRGERSMLEMFQDVGIALKDKELFTFASFDAMYEGIRSTLYTGLIMAINQAEHNVDDPLAIRALKTLLLVKYVKEFRPTIENLKVLLATNLDGDMAAFETRLRESLNRLERETYLRRTGEVYEYLTNDEKDAEEEIRRVAVELQQYRKHVADYLFSEILRSSKIRYDENSEDYAFQRGVDDESLKGQGDLAIRLVTPWHPDADDRTRLRMRAMGRKELSIMLPAISEFMDELETYFKTESWLRMIDANSPKYARIVADKRAHNDTRKRKLGELLKNLFREAEFAIADSQINPTGSTAYDRIERAFQELVRRSYPGLRMLKVHYTQESLRKILFPTDDLYGEGGGDRTEAETEMLSWIQRKKADSQPVTLDGIKEEFKKGQYGWYEWATLCVVALLFIHQEIELSKATEILGKNEVFTTLNQNRGHEFVSIKPAPKISMADMQRLGKLHFSLFHKDNPGQTSKDMGIAFKTALFDLRTQLEGAIRTAPDFAFLESLKAASSKLSEILKKEWHYFLEQYNDFAPELENLIENTVDPGLKFLNGPNMSTWRSIDAWLSDNHDNLAELDMPDALNAIRGYRKSPELYRTSDTKHAKDLWTSLLDKQKSLVAAERAAAAACIRGQYEKLAEVPEWKAMSEEVRENIHRRFGELEAASASARSLGAIRDIGITKARHIYEESISKIAEQAKKRDPSSEVRYATAEERWVGFQKSALLTESDVDDYAAALAKAWKKLIAEGKRIQL